MPTTPPWYVLPQQHPNKKTVATSDSNSSAKKQYVIVGSGLAGCHTAFEIAQRGFNVRLIDASDTVAGGASANSAGIVKPFVTRSPGITDNFYAQAFTYLIDRLYTNERLCKAAQFNQCGVLQLLERAYPINDCYSNCTPAQSSQLAGVDINAHAILFTRGGWLNPAALCQAIVEHHNIELQLNTVVRNITQTDSGWSLTIDANSSQHDIHCDGLILANGHQLNQFAPTTELPIIPARGQTSRFICENHALKTVVTGKRYAIPDDNSVIVGASFIRNNEDKALSAIEHQENLSGVNALLPSLHPQPEAVSGFCGIRATTPDRLPLVGPVPEFSQYRKDYALLKHGLPHHSFPNARYRPGLFVIGGFGSRGIVSAPYCAMLLARYLCEPVQAGNETISGNKESVNKLEQLPDSQLTDKTLTSWSTLLHPGRFLVRGMKRSHHLVNSDSHE